VGYILITTAYLAAICFRILWLILRLQELTPIRVTSRRNIYRLSDYGREQNLFEERLPDYEIERKIRQRFWNPRYTKPHWPWQDTEPPPCPWRMHDFDLS
jgi:hypothetical protein